MLTCISRRLRQVPSQSCGKYRPSHSKYEHGCSRYAHVYIEDTKESTEPYSVAVHNMLTCISRRLRQVPSQSCGKYRPSHSKYEHGCSRYAHVYIEDTKESTEPVTRNMNM
ncbi:hypothetical protein J6590_067239 [Homalodisca vitripennis]|nr:hypothetical protein J6590_067239 [Homalodisca vitripennis]